MLFVADARAKADQVFSRKSASWVARLAWEMLVEKGLDANECPAFACLDARVSSAFESEDVGASPSFENEDISMPLHPPTEREALADLAAAQRWVADWRALDGELVDGTSVLWEERRWASVGQQRVPVRLILHGADAIASFAGEVRQWDIMKARVGEFSSLCAQFLKSCLADNVYVALRRTAAEIASLSEGDWTRALEVIGWMARHDTSCYFVREMPIAGVHSKWVDAHRKVIFPLVSCITGEVPKFKGVLPQKRVHVLDASLAPGGLTDFQATAQGLAQLTCFPDRVIICENLATTLALPQMSGTFAIHGGGYGVTDLAEVEWLHRVPLYYWGDLDTHGFAILNALRVHFPHAESVLMDRETLELHRVYCVEEPTPVLAKTICAHLTEEERGTLEMLSRDGRHDRLEQERITWPYALDVLRRVSHG